MDYEKKENDVDGLEAEGEKEEEPVVVTTTSEVEGTADNWPPPPDAGEEGEKDSGIDTGSEDECPYPIDPDLGPPQKVPTTWSINRMHAERMSTRAKQLASMELGSFYVSGYVCDEPVEILIDEGAEVTSISPSMLKQIPAAVRPPLHKCGIEMKGMGETQLGVLGAVEITLTIGGETREAIAAVVQELDNAGIDFIIGSDFTSVHNFYLRTALMKCIWGENDLRIDVYRSRSTRTYGRLVMAEQVQIAPHKRVRVKVALEGHPDMITYPCMYIEEEPTWKIRYPGVNVVRGVIDLRAGHWWIQVENLSPEIVELEEGDMVAKLTPAQKVEELPQERENGENTLRLIRATILKLETVEAQKTKEQAASDPDPSDVIGESKEGQEENQEVSDRGKYIKELQERLPEHMRVLLKELPSSLTDAEVLMIVELLEEYEDIFQSPDEPLGRTDVVKHHIDVQGHPPIKQAPRRLPYHRQEIVKEELKKMLDQDLIRPSDSPWASPIVLVTKKDGTTRFCIDYRKLNDVTRKDAFPLPRIDESLDTLAGAKYFCTLDLASGYWQVEMAEEDREKTAFCTKYGLFEFNVMPFGLCNAPATFEKLTERALAGLQWEECLVYIDDVIIFGRTFLEVLQRLGRVFERFRQYQLKIKAKKCDLFKKIVEFLGHLVSEEGIQCDPKKLSRVKDWPTPKNVSEVRSFLGLAGYYRKFINNFSTLAGPLVELTQKDVPFTWSARQEFSMQELKKSLLTAPVLAYPDMDRQFLLDTDASGTGIGGVLSQVQPDGEERPVAYASFTLNKSQRRYCTTKRELLAVVVMIEHFKQYLLGRHFVVRTDHASLLWLKAFKDPEGILARWLTRLELYNFQMKHREGRLHMNADTLSRLGASPTICEDMPKLCKFAGCEECRPRRSDEQLAKMVVSDEDMMKFAVRVMQTRSKANLGPRRSERLAGKQQRHNKGKPQKKKVKRNSRGRIKSKRPGRPRRKTRTPQATHGVGPGGDNLMSRQGPSDTLEHEELALECFSEEQKADSLLPVLSFGPEDIDDVAEENIIEEVPVEEVEVETVEEEQVENIVETNVEAAEVEAAEETPQEEVAIVEEEVEIEEPRSQGEPPTSPSGTGPEPRYSLRPRNTAPVNPEGTEAFEALQTPEGENENSSEAEETTTETVPRNIPVREIGSNWLDLVTNQEIAELQQQDIQCRAAKRWLQNGCRPTVKEMKGAERLTRALWAQFDNLKMHDGVLYRQCYFEGNQEPVWQTIVPHGLRRRIFKALHSDAAAGHLGVDRTLSNIRTNFYWPGCKDQIKLWVKQCKICNENVGKPRKTHKAGLTQRGIGGPFEIVAFDILQLVTTSSKNKYLLVICDQFTKWVEAIPLVRHDARSVAVAFVHEWICRYGTPRQLHSDKGTDLTGQVMTEIYKLLQIDKTATTAFRPQSNGQVERMNRSICKMLRAFIQEWKHQDWDTMVPMVMSAYRRSVHESTKFTPNKMVFGRECNLPVHLMYGVPQRYPTCPVAFVQDIAEKMREMHELARDSMKLAADRQKRNYDRYVGQKRRFYVGDQVNYYYAPKDHKVTSRPWEHYIVTKVWDEENPILYTISKGKRSKSRQVHIDNLLPYYGTDEIAPWWGEKTNTVATQVSEHQLVPPERRSAPGGEDTESEEDSDGEDSKSSTSSGSQESARFARVEKKKEGPKFIFEKKEGDLFECPNDESLAHCISADAHMGGGIAVPFKQKFGGIHEILAQNVRPGGVAVLHRGERFIYYLVTKEKYWHLPSYKTLLQSLEAMREHCRQNGVTKLSMPCIGCGLDRLAWDLVESIIKSVFSKENIKITIYTLPMRNLQSLQNDLALERPLDGMEQFLVWSGTTKDHWKDVNRWIELTNERIRRRREHMDEWEAKIIDFQVKNECVSVNLIKELDIRRREYKGELEFQQLYEGCVEEITSGIEQEGESMIQEIIQEIMEEGP